MHPVLRATKRGKKELFIMKYFIGISISFILLVLVYAPMVVTFVSRYNISDWNAPIQNIMVFSGVSGNISILQLFIMEAVVLVIGTVCMSVVVIFISQLAKKQSATIIAAGLICILPILASMLKLPFIGFITFANAFTLPNAVIQYGTQANLIYLAGLVIVTIGILTASWKKYKLNR